MAFHLVVTQAFGAYAIGQRIERADEVEAISCAHPGSAVRVLAESVVRVLADAELASPAPPEMGASDDASQPATPN